MLQYFSKHEHIKFKYDYNDSHLIDMDTLNYTIILKYCSSTNVYTLDLEDNDAQINLLLITISDSMNRMLNFHIGILVLIQHLG